MRLTLEDRAILCGPKRGTNNQECMDTRTAHFVLTREPGVAAYVKERIEWFREIGDAALVSSTSVY